MVLQHLDLAERHVSQGRERVHKQAALLARLERDGHNTEQAKSLLEQLERALSLQIESRDRIQRELDTAG
jgi:hypothetical protein